MTTDVTGPARRSEGISSESFAGIVPTGCQVVSIRPAGSMLTVTFDCDLDAATVTAVRDYMTSTDDAEQAARAELRNLRSAAAVADLSTPQGLEALRSALTAAIDFLLGDN